ncbi:MAG: hypothetical protein HFH86_02775 [Bacilli bacterium]|nr:hypothetical protein [Bacilli bacterium]
MAINRNKIELKRVNINLPVDLVQRVIDYGESMGLKATPAYIVLLNQALDQKDTMNNLPALLDLFKSEMAKNNDNSENKD